MTTVRATNSSNVNGNGKIHVADKRTSLLEMVLPPEAFREANDDLVVAGVALCGCWRCECDTKSNWVGK